MHFTAEHEMADKVEISRLVLVYIGLCWTLNLISLYGIITLTKLYGKRWNPIDETKPIHCKLERDWYMTLPDVSYCVSGRKMFIIHHVLYTTTDVSAVI